MSAPGNISLAVATKLPAVTVPLPGAIRVYVGGTPAAVNRRVIAPVTVDTPDGAHFSADHVTLRGRARPGVTVIVILGGIPRAVVIADAGGHWFYTPLALPDGDQTVSASVLDAEGRTVTAPAHKFTVAPSAP